ncbi:S-formylglutathione hydrolase [Aliikangiella maris]|uniref:S-formylglutathione hydrolase n=2 Tax=Aliikangiella maris TaxID=3162458 RepID=A0ABV3MJ48_9GAMM
MNWQTISEQKSFGGTQGVYRHNASTTRCEMELSVYVPHTQGAEGDSTSKQLPVLYYLSGLTCTQENVTTKAGFQQFANEFGFIVVCPDTSPRGSELPGEHDSYDFGSGAGFYVNATQPPWSAQYQMYDYIVKELPPLIEQHFPVDHKRCGIFGHSMGGHGALTIGLRNPEQYQSISAFSPIVAPMQCPWGQKAFSGYLGSEQTSWQQYDATALINNGHRSSHAILIDQGGSDNFLAEQLKPELFTQACEEKNQPVTLRVHPGYDHSYYFISSFMRDHFVHHAANLNTKN